MKKSKIKVNGVVYKYIITEDNTIRYDGIVPYTTSEEIKRRLIKKGIYDPNKKDDYKEVLDPKKRFEKWCNTELKILAEDKSNSLSELAKVELERRNQEWMR